MSRLPSFRPKELVAALKRVGFVEHHQKGSHLFLWIFWDSPKLQMTTVPMHAKDVRRPLLKKIIKQSGLSEDEFIEFL